MCADILHWLWENWKLIHTKTCIFYYLITLWPDWSRVTVVLIAAINITLIPKPEQGCPPTLMISSMKHTWVTGSLFFIRTFCKCCTWKICGNVISISSVLLTAFVFNVLKNGSQGVCTCLHAAHIWSISFSRLVHRAARKAAVLPGVGSTALPGAP